MRDRRDRFDESNALVLGEHNRERMATGFADASDGDPLAAAFPNSRPGGCGLLSIRLYLPRDRVDGDFV